MKKRNQKAWAVTLGIIVFSFLCCPCHADWITAAEFSEKADIDSLERFLVIPDIDPGLVFGRQIVSLGDITGDSISDILIQRWPGLALEDNRAFLFYGGNPPDTIYDDEFLNFLPSFDNVGDVDSDGYDDICMRHFYSYSPFHIDIEFYFGGPDMDDSADFVIPNLLSWIPKAADLDNDGNLDMAFSVDFNDSAIVNIYQIGNNKDTIPDYILKDTSKSFGNNLATGDFNGDDYPDLAVAGYRNRDSCFVKFYWGGPEFDTIPDFEIYRKSDNLSIMFGNILLPTGDFNGDGYGDILISGMDDQNPYGVYFGGPDIDNEVDLILNEFRYGPGYYPVSSADIAGDLNNDGYVDLILGCSIDLMYLHEISIFLGGPDVDTIPDVYIENQHIPGGQIDFGEEVAGIGDFNGDGIDDFAVRSRTTSFSDWRGEVNFFAGWNSHSTDVEYDYEPTIPKEFNLNHNYPNPFNLSTTIEFQVPFRSKVKLTICDILGREVATLINKELGAGLYRIGWDGRDKHGYPVSSGIYFCTLSADQFSATRKTVLLK